MFEKMLKRDQPRGRLSSYANKLCLVFDWTVDILVYGSVLLIAFLMLSISLNVVLGYGANAAIRWISEVSRYCLLWITFLGVTWVLKKEGHVKMDLLVSRLNAASQALVNFGTSILGAMACLVFTWYGIKSINYYFQIGFVIDTMLAPPKWPIMAVIPAGGLLLFLQFSRRAYRYFFQWRVPDNEKRGKVPWNGS